MRVFNIHRENNLVITENLISQYQAPKIFQRNILIITLFLSFLFLLVACNLIKETDTNAVRSYFWPCPQNAVYTYHLYQNGEKQYEKIVVISECEVGDNFQLMTVNEEINYLVASELTDGKPIKKKYKYLIEKKEITKIDPKTKMGNSVLEAPIKVGSTCTPKTVPVEMLESLRRRKEILYEEEAVQRGADRQDFA